MMNQLLSTKWEILANLPYAIENKEEICFEFDNGAELFETNFVPTDIDLAPDESCVDIYGKNTTVCIDLGRWIWAEESECYSGMEKQNKMYLTFPNRVVLEPAEGICPDLSEHILEDEDGNTETDLYVVEDGNGDMKAVADKNGTFIAL